MLCKRARGELRFPFRRTSRIGHLQVEHLEIECLHLEGMRGGDVPEPATLSSRLPPSLDKGEVAESRTWAIAVP